MEDLTIVSDVDDMITELNQYTQLMIFLLNKIFVDNQEDQFPDFVEQIILRYAKSLGYVELNDNKDFQLSYKGVRLLNIMEDNYENV